MKIFTRLTLLTLVLVAMSGCASSMYTHSKYEARAAFVVMAESCGERDDKGAKKKLLGKIYNAKFGIASEPSKDDDNFLQDSDFQVVSDAAKTEYECFAAYRDWANEHLKAAQPAINYYFQGQKDIFQSLLSKDISYGSAKRRLRTNARMFFSDLKELEELDDYRKSARDKAYGELIGEMINQSFKTAPR